MQTTITRPSQPLDLTATSLAGFDLAALAEQLMQEKPFLEHGRNALTLVRSTDLSVVLTVAKANKTVQEHRSAGPTTLLMLSGSLTFSTTSHDYQEVVTRNMAIAFAFDVEHFVEVHEDSVFLLVIGGRQVTPENFLGGPP